MDKKLLYTRDYYTVRRLNEERTFIDLLNADEQLVGLVFTSLWEVKNRLLNIIQDGKLFNDFASLIRNENSINEILAIKLSENKLFLAISDKGLSTKLYTESFYKLCKRIFAKDGVNNEKYVIQYNIHSWLENNLAKIILQDNRFAPLSILIQLMRQTEMLHHFYGDIKDFMPQKWINDEIVVWAKTSENPDYIINGLRTFDKDYFKGYELLLHRSEGSANWNFIFETTRFSDQAMLSDEFAFKSSVLLDKNLTAWLSFWDNLRLPILQDISFNYIQYPLDILRIAKELVRQRNKIKSKAAHLACILLKNSFEASLKVTEKLSFYNDHQRTESLSPFEKDEIIIANGKNAFDEWAKEKKVLYKKLITVLCEILTPADVEDWAFSYRHRSLPRNQFTDKYNSEIDNIVSTYTNYSKKIPLEKKLESLQHNFGLEKFNFGVSQIRKSTISEDLREKLLRQLADFVRSDKFFWDKTYSPAYWNTLKGIGFLLSIGKNPVLNAVELVDMFKMNHEGWKIESDYKLANCESFILCGIALLLEHKHAFKNKEERVAFFEYLSNLIIQQSRFSVIDVVNDYQMPLHILCLVVNQIYKDLKSHFEIEIVQNMDNLITILKILGSDNYEMKPKSKKLLKKRIERELIFTKRKFVNNDDRQNLNLIDKSIEKLGLS